MRSKRFSEEQIIAVLKESEAGAKTKDLCRRHGISEPTFYNWKARYAGMTVSEVRRLKELEQENARLKRLLADAELDKAALKDLLHRKL
jgi:putative transposase